MKRTFAVMCLLLCSILVAGCVGVSEPSPAEYQKHVTNLPGEFGVIWTDEANKDIVHLAVFSEDYFRVIDDSSVERAVSENERAVKKYVENLLYEYTYTCLFIEEIGNGMLVVSYMESGDSEPYSYTIEKDVYLEVHKDNPLFVYPETFMPVDEVVQY